MKRQGLEDEDLSDKMRLDKLLALLGEGTRSEIKAMVRAGRVTVDGRAAKDAGMQVCGETDDIRLDGRALYYKAVRHVMLNKPSGVLTAARDKKQKTVMDLLPPMYAAMGAMPAGRLDKDTEGLLVITSDGQLAHRIISPKHEVGKVYYARLDGELTDEDVAALEAGYRSFDTAQRYGNKAPPGKCCKAAARPGRTCPPTASPISAARAMTASSPLSRRACPVCAPTVWTCFSSTGPISSGDGCSTPGGQWSGSMRRGGRWASATARSAAWNGSWRKTGCRPP